MIKISGYSIGKEIGSGGMATVYEGVQDSLNRAVAIKVMRQQLADNQEVTERFESESYIIAQLNHPHIVQVIDRGLTADHTPYFIMSLLQGKDLAQLMKRGGVAYQQKVDLLIQVCKALAYAHKNGVIHRDIKPANIFIDTEERAHVLDFGIAHFLGEEGDNSPNSTEDQTQPGTVMGTLAYMSPEQKISAHLVTSLSDLYSLGVMMYVVFTGQKPKNDFVEPIKLSTEVSPELNRLILDCLQTEPSARPCSADIVKDDLLKLLQGTHLEEELVARADEGITSIKKRFSLLDVIKEEKYSSVYLYESRVDHKLLVIKKRPIWSKGFDATNLLKPLKHKNIATIFGTSKNSRTYIIVMEYLSGGSLQDRLIAPHDWWEALEFMRAIALGLLHAHQNGVVHGNLRPANVLFDEQGHIKLTDFGLDAHYQMGDERNWYKLASESISRRTDIFAAGVILFQLLTSELPTWRNRKLTDSKHIDALPTKVQVLLHKMLNWTPTSRHNSAREVVEEIDVLLDFHEQQQLEELAITRSMAQQAVVRKVRVAKRAFMKKVLMALGAVSISGVLAYVLVIMRVL
ncbi:MAG: eukaryotic-like serine/threonine-protein kinase [Methyloprofundus sp.]|nr:MAG: eukaryotic-like serine/threonine-protein kinase [Methyloprofundus sp.]